MFDPRILVGPAQAVLGAAALYVSLRLWFVHPINRVFRVGPFLTERGMRVLLNLRLTIFSWGCFLTVQATTNVIFWFVREARVNDPLVQAMGSFGAGMGIWASSMTISALVRLWQSR